MGYIYSYSYVGDAITIILSIVCWILLSSSYSIKRKNLTLFKVANIIIMVAALCSIWMHYMIEHYNPVHVVWITLLYHVTYIIFACMFNLYLSYMMDIFVMGKTARVYAFSVFGVISVAVIIWHILENKFDLGFYIENNQIMVNPTYEIFRYAYVFFAIIMLFFMVHYRKRFITKMYFSLMAIAGIGIFIYILEEFIDDRSFTVFSFMIPIFAVLFLYHYNAFDRDTGSLDEKAFSGYIEEIKDKKFTIIYLQLKGITAMPTISPDLQMQFYHFNESYFKKPITFRLAPGKMALVYLEEDNVNAGTTQIQLFNDFEQLYQKFKIDYRIMVISGNSKLRTGTEYINLLEYFENRMEWNQVQRFDDKDVEDFSYALTVLQVLMDISAKNDLDDPRVKVYCQPILQVKEGKFTTAEALMRIETPELGMIYPDVFIPIAEQFNYIHPLSCIILNKVCKAIKEFNKEYRIDRVSVNFSIPELKSDSFSEDILKIIESHQIPFEQIALELTESRDTYSHDLVKTTMNTLKKYGIHMYLDDFGTGYSNFERILDLPIDIIKFDRSLTIISGEDETSAYMVENFATIFKKANYSILYEGIESGKDEQRCIDMQAEYLQGYRYARPIPIEELPKFLDKKQ